MACYDPIFIVNQPELLNRTRIWLFIRSYTTSDKVDISVSYVKPRSRESFSLVQSFVFWSDLVNQDGKTGEQISGPCQFGVKQTKTGLGCSVVYIGITNEKRKFFLNDKNFAHTFIMFLSLWILYDCKEHHLCDVTL